MAAIGFIEATQPARRYGGHLYEHELRAALSTVHQVEHVVPSPVLPGRAGTIESVARLAMASGAKDLWIRNYYSSLTMPFDRTKGKNLIIVHHVDTSQLPPLSRLICGLLSPVYHSALLRADMVVAVSEFWRRRLSGMGCKSVEVIHNSFDPKEFAIGAEEVAEFMERHGLGGRPIVYLGNCQKAKGAVDAYAALEGIDARLVTSGKPHARLPALNPRP